MNLLKLKTKYRIVILAVALLTVGVAVSCKTKEKAADTITEDDWLYEYYEQPDNTSPEVEAWLKSVKLDSAERVLSRQDGYVKVGDTTLKVWLVDVLRHFTSQAMEYPFQELVDSLDMSICRTKDGRLRVLYWDTGLGGTCPDIERHTLLKADDGSIHLLEDGHDSPQLLDIYSLKTKMGETVYLLHEYYREWSSYGAAWAWCCRVKGNTLDTLALFPHGDTAVGVEYGIPGWYFTANDGEGWEWLFELHGDNFYVPVVVSDGITDRYDLYRWNGQRFDSIGNVGNRRLHPSLQQYDELSFYFITKGFRVRIDHMADDSYRYASWPRSKTTFDKPDLIINGGRYDEKQSCFIFENDGYTYRVGSYSPAANSKGFWGIIVEKEGKVLLQQEKE